MAVNQTLLHRINRLEEEADRELDLRSVATHRICDECETVAYCGRHGCIPKRPLVARELGVEAALPSRFTNEPQQQDEPELSLRWFFVIVALAIALAVIRSMH